MRPVRRKGGPAVSHLTMDLFDFERLVAIGFAADPDQDRITAHGVRLAPHGERGTELRVYATDSHILATRVFDGMKDALDGTLDAPIVIPSSGLFEVFGAIKQMVKIDRGKYDPTGWSVELVHDTNDVEDLEIVVWNSFREKRGTLAVPTLSTDPIDYSRLEATAPAPVVQIGFSPNLLVRLAKSTGVKDTPLGWRFTGERSVVHVRRQGDPLWQGICMPASFDSDLWESA